MRQGLGMLTLGALAPVVQGALQVYLPVSMCPQLGVLVVLGLGLAWPNALGGMLVAALVGFVSDLLSGSLGGQLVLLHLGAYLATRYASAHLDLSGPLSTAIFAAGFTALYGLALVLSTLFFLPEAGLGWGDLRLLLPVALLNGLFAPWVVALVERLLTRLEAPQFGRRRVFLGPQGSSR